MSITTPPTTPKMKNRTNRPKLKTKIARGFSTLNEKLIDFSGIFINQQNFNNNSNCSNIRRNSFGGVCGGSGVGGDPNEFDMLVLKTVEWEDNESY